MTRLEPPADAMDEVTCSSRDGGQVEVMSPREVPLGGPRAMTVRRTLPQRSRTLVGAWCFVDHYGPDQVAESGGMKVAPHPHTGLQTVSWLFTGEIEHRDSAGHHAMVRPGELNLMTAGSGISHSEVSTARTTTLHGAQLWVALPAAHRATDPGFTHYVPDPVGGPGWEARVFLGSLLGSTSPVATFSPLVGAELLLEAGTSLDLDVDPAHEHAVLVDAGAPVVAGAPTTRGDLAYLPTGAAGVRVEAGEEPVRALLLGGEPLGEAIVMFWNFIGADHDEVAAYREEWQAQITRDGEVVADSQDVADGRFGTVVGDHHRPIPAPALPTVRLKERR
ncbi:MAG: pirin family protein [Actinobacteria bacterium]|jgi:quercetin 2,3-dioxygenase|nr:pirin family protein [Actinomycetota bacterium]